ncbi:single-stranded DNA-binding protein [Vagococcus entomophilus]|uniref:Single-stranded DNA-binding protein n=1 Tax=Vagococcus entomophilus TaxID=1160095 RepID=A0A430AG51_9ENTE|nr:single-stranded DNA-binding protein [Vagococcus entomophilus]RSU06871.1 single-stranded DNA-binding protein [Vagococcus entomophilus]
MINNVVLVGRLTKDPDLRYTASGTAVATFTLAVNRNFTNQNGNRDADFINCVIWRKPAETMANIAKKGTLMGATGRIQTRNYENQQGQRVYVTEVVCDNFQLLESKAASEQRQHSDNSYSDYGQSNFGAPQSNNTNQSFAPTSGQSTKNETPSFERNTSDPFGDSSQIDISDDDLPF